MKVQVKVSPKVLVEADGETQTDVFQQLAALQEVFGRFDKCGKCGGTDLRFIVREDKDENKYHEIHCQNPECRARLAFGQNKKGGGLFPKRKDGDNYLPDGGWLRWNKKKGVSE